MERFLSPLVDTVSEHTGGEVSWGLWHRLTGESIGVSPSLVSILQAARTTPLAEAEMTLLPNRRYAIATTIGH